VNAVALPLRFALYGATTAIVASSASWFWILMRAVLAGLACLLLERWLRPRFHFESVFVAVLGFSASAALTGAPGSTGVVTPALILAATVGLIGLEGGGRFGRARWWLAAALSVSPAAYLVATGSGASLSADNLLVRLFGSQGLLYQSPLLWLGFLGLPGLARGRPIVFGLCGAALLPGVLALTLSVAEGASGIQAATWLPCLVPGIALCMERIRNVAERQPEKALVGLGCLLVLWNSLFAEQYRRRDIPSDDTVSFSQVASGSASLVSRFTGTPWAWPANWIFAARFDVKPDRWDAAAGRDLFTGPGAQAGTIEIGDDSVFSADRALCLDGFGVTRTCEKGACRDLDGVGRILLPLGQPTGGDLVIRARVRGEGDLKMSFNDSATAVSRLETELTDVTLRVPARLVRPGFSVLSLSVGGPADKGTLDRVTLMLGPGAASAR
jgi:hypothetical protein